jgi:hypothetical protein
MQRRFSDLPRGRLEKVTKMSLLSLQNRRKVNAMDAMGTEQSSLGLTASHDLYEVRPRKDRDGFDLINELFRYGPIWYAGPDAVRNAVAYAKYRSHFRSQRAIIRVLDDSGAVIRMHE